MSTSSPASNNENSSSQLITTKPEIDGVTSDGVPNETERKQQLLDSHRDLNHPRRIEKHEKYDADFSRYLRAKYFSKKNLFGGNIYEEKTTIGDEFIWASRWTCTRSFVDPAGSFEDLTRCISTPSTEAPATANGKQQTEKD